MSKSLRGIDADITKKPTHRIPIWEANFGVVSISTTPDLWFQVFRRSNLAETLSRHVSFVSPKATTKGSQRQNFLKSTRHAFGTFPTHHNFMVCCKQQGQPPEQICFAKSKNSKATLGAVHPPFALQTRIDYSSDRR